MSTNPEEFGAQPYPIVQIDPAQFGAIANVDEKRGAPNPVRISVGASKRPEDKLATLQKFYPDATYWGEDNFVFTDPETKNRTLFNPKGMDMGDVHENARMIAEFIGGSVAGTAAAVGGQLGPQVLTPEEAITVPLAVGVGAAAGGKVYDWFTDLFTPSVDTRSFTEQAAGIGTDIMVNAIGTKVGDMLATGVRKGMAAGSKLARSSGDEIYKAFKSMGVKPTAGAVTGSPTLQGIEQALSKLPASADIIGKEYGQLIDDMGKYAADVSKGLSPVEGREMVGSEIRQGVTKFVNKFKQKANTLYDEVDRYIAPDARITATNFGAKVDETLGKFANDPEFGEVLTSPLFKQLKAAYTVAETKGGITYSTLKALRTKIGQSLDDKQLLGDTAQAELKQLYGALSDDMIYAAAQKGPEALKAAERASKFWAAGRSRIDDVLTPVVNKKLNQDIFQAALSGAKNGSEKLRAIKKSMPTEEWNAVVAQQIKEMGRSTAGKQDVTGELFSPASFLTNYNKLSKEAKRTLFSGKQYQGLEDAINNLKITSAALKETEKMANTSGTAQQLMYMQILTGGLGGLYGSGEEGDPMGGALQGMALGMAAPWVTAKLVTSPKFINWLADAGKTSMNKSAMGKHLGLLSGIAAEDKVIAPAIYEYMRTINTKGQGATNEQ